MSIQGIHHVTLIVNDEKRAAWFYGEVLGLPEKPRHDFSFPGLFYRCGDQEVHLIVTARPLLEEKLFIHVGGKKEVSFHYIHRHAAFLVGDWPGLRQRLEANQIPVVFSEATANPNDSFAQNLMAGWRKMYGGVPIFCLDPFENLLELVPAEGKNWAER